MNTAESIVFLLQYISLSFCLYIVELVGKIWSKIEIVSKTSAKCIRRQLSLLFNTKQEEKLRMMMLTGASLCICLFFYDFNCLRLYASRLVSPLGPRSDVIAAESVFVIVTASSSVGTYSSLTPPISFNHNFFSVKKKHTSHNFLSSSALFCLNCHLQRFPSCWHLENIPCCLYHAKVPPGGKPMLSQFILIIGAQSLSSKFIVKAVHIVTHSFTI